MKRAVQVILIEGQYILKLHEWNCFGKRHCIIVYSSSSAAICYYAYAKRFLDELTRYLS